MDGAKVIGDCETRRMGRRVLLAAVLSLPLVLPAVEPAEDGFFLPDLGWERFRVWGVTEFESARWQHGRIDDDHPHWCNIAFAEMKTPFEGFTVGTMYYGDTYLTGYFDHTIRRFMYENDLFPYVRHDWQIAEGWALHSQLVQSGLTFLTGYRNESRHNNTFYWDYRGTETLDTPWFSVWVFFRNMINFDKRLDVNWGVRRVFDLPLDFKLALKAMFFGGDSVEAECRYGLPPQWQGENRYDFGVLNAMLADVTLLHPLPFFDHLSVYVSFREFALIDPTVREASDCRPRPTNYRDLAMLAMGVGYDF